VETAWSSGVSRPEMAIFRAMVELAVKTTWSGRGQPSSRAARHRVSYTVREAAMEAPWAPRAALPAVQMASATARATWGGLCREVAALSR
jgi:hypothetical protein